jgi:hypothetical protein
MADLLDSTSFNRPPPWHAQDGWGKKEIQPMIQSDKKVIVIAGIEPLDEC